jgi:HD-like signal output (HDOD) protein
MPLVTRESVAEKLGAYLRHDLSLAAFVDWAESALMNSDFDPANLTTIRDAVARIGAADVRTFGLAWEDCEHLLSQLGYSAQVSIVAR